MRILVTGADGFIGSHLVEHLVQQGHQVRAFCLYNSFGHKGWLDKADPQVLNSTEFYHGDVRDYDSVEKAVKNIEVIFHLASLIAIPYSYQAPESYIDTNVKGTHNVLRAALRSSVKQLIHTSTSEVYGTAQFVPISEKHPLVGQSPYSASKISADQIAFSYFCSFGLPVSTVRPFNTYGPRQSNRAIIPTVINQVLSGKKTLRLGNIKATRDFSFITDTVKGVTSFLNNEKTFGEVINLGTGTEISIEKVVKLISEISGIDLTIEMDEKRLRPEKSEVERLCSDITKAKAILDWQPEYATNEGFKKGLTLTYDWFKKYAYLYSNSLNYEI